MTGTAANSQEKTLALLNSVERSLCKHAMRPLNHVDAASESNWCHIDTLLFPEQKDRHERRLFLGENNGEQFDFIFYENQEINNRYFFLFYDI